MDTPAEELLKKIRQLEARHAMLKQEMSKLMLNNENEAKSDYVHRRSYSVSPRRSRFGTLRRKGGGFEAATAWKKGSTSFRHASPLQRESRSRDASSIKEGGPAAARFSDRQYLNILQSMGQAIHIFDLEGRIIYWNRYAELLYGYSESEALGQDAMELLIDASDYDVANNIVNQTTIGENWTGQFPVKNKSGDRFLAVVTNTPFYDDNSHLVGIICVSTDARPFQEIKVPLSTTTSSTADSVFCRSRSCLSNKAGVDSQQPLQAAITSKISNLASKVTNKVRSRIRTSENSMDQESGVRDGQHSDLDTNLSDHKEDGVSSGASTPRGGIPPSHFAVSYSSVTEEKSLGSSVKGSAEEGEPKTGIQKIISSKAEAWIFKKGISWPWKGNERDGPDGNTRSLWPWLHNEQENDLICQKNSKLSQKLEQLVSERNRPGNNEASGSWFSFNVNSTSSVSSSGSTSNSAIHKVDMETDCLDYEILWEDLTIGEHIGQGSCGTVYHGLWYGSDVAIKVFSKQEYSDEVMLSFKQEVSLMKRLRHPNILLFMGAVTSPKHLCIVTEFLPRIRYKMLV